jgi:hypothetical protein
MATRHTSPFEPAALTRWLLIVAQVLVLLALGLGLQFIINTTGGTLFLFASVAPLLVTIAIAIAAGVVIYRFRKRHSLFSIETYEPGEIIFRQGESGDVAYFVQSGEVQVLEEEGGVEKPIGVLSEGQYFGEMALLSNAPRNATVRARTAAKLAVLGKGNFLTMLSVMPHIHEDIMKTVKERAMKHV